MLKFSTNKEFGEVATALFVVQPSQLRLQSSATKKRRTWNNGPCNSRSKTSPNVIVTAFRH